METLPDSRCLQAAAAVMMVRPAAFTHNEQTSATNRFQHRSADATPLAQAEFDVAVRLLAEAGIRVCVIDDTHSPHKPDALFPNNWISFHCDGTIVLYPMLAPNRRLERRPEIVQWVEQRLGFRPRRLVDISTHEEQGRFLEGTGSLVLDHARRIAFASRSARTDESLVRQWAHEMQYEPVLFDAAGDDGTPVYHTNVLLSIGTQWAVVCTACILERDRERILGQLRQQREVIEIPPVVMKQFGANILELRADTVASGERRILVLSTRALRAFEQMPGDGWKRLQSAVDQVVPIAVPVIEDVGGGGIRCMLAEVPDVAA